MSTFKSASSASISSSLPLHPLSTPFGLPLTLRGRFLLSGLFASAGIWLISHLMTPSREEYMHRFWLADLPPLGGAQRIYIYLGLLLSALHAPYTRPRLGDSPLQAPELLSYTLPKFFSREGLMRLLYSRAWVNRPVVAAIRFLTLLSFVLCILGFGGRLPSVIVGVGMFLLHGVVLGCIGTSHRWYVPVYTCLALMFSCGRREWSLDALFSRHFGGYPFRPHCWDAPASLSCTGFARKLILVLGVCTLFFGFLAKLLNGRGIAWADGRSLGYYVSSGEEGQWPWLKRVIRQNRLVSMALSVGSLGLEGLSPLAMFFPHSRLPLLLAAAGMHAGIWATMSPNYLPQTICYAAGVAWTWEGETVNNIVTASAGQAVVGTAATGASFPALDVAQWSGLWLSLYLLSVALLRIEYWPLSGIPMYSFYRGDRFSHDHFFDCRQAQETSLVHAQAGYPNVLAWSGQWVKMGIENREAQGMKTKGQQEARKHSVGTEQSTVPCVAPPRLFTNFLCLPSIDDDATFIDLHSRICHRAFTRGGQSGVVVKQWRRAMHNAAAEDMAAKPWGEIEARGDYPGQRWLLDILPALREAARENEWKLPEWVERTGELQLRAKLRDGDAILATLAWNAVVPPLNEDNKRK